MPLPSFLRRPSLRPILVAASWIPVYMVFHNHVGQFMWVTGPSMYPYLNTDYDRSTAKDVVWVDMWRPMNGLRRGMCVAFW
jgi:mitochondrial inner membrane protease subunit 2